VFQAHCERRLLKIVKGFNTRLELHLLVVRTSEDVDRVLNDVVLTIQSPRLSYGPVSIQMQSSPRSAARVEKRDLLDIVKITAKNSLE
jgi:hypothetical protein